MAQVQVVVVGNEKGGAGKSTIAIHLATALMRAEARVAVIDLDLRQRSMDHFFARRQAWSASAGVELTTPVALSAPDSGEGLAGWEALISEACAVADHVVIDTPGGDTPLSRAAHGCADLIVTPMNDSFVDFDMLGEVDPVTLDLKRPSLYSETVWEARKARAAGRGRSIDWVVLRNRLAPTEARNRKRLEERIAALSRRVGFRIGPGLRDRVIYRELYPFGLTVADLRPGVRPVPVSLGHIAARQELRALLQALGLSALVEEPLKAAS